MLSQVSEFISLTKLGTTTLENLQSQTSGNMIQYYRHIGYEFPKGNVHARTQPAAPHVYSYATRANNNASLPIHPWNHDYNKDYDTLFTGPGDLHSTTSVLMSILGMTIQSYDITGSNMPNISPDDRPSDINKSLVAGAIPLSKTYREVDLHQFHALGNERNHLRASQITYTTNAVS